MNTSQTRTSQPKPISPDDAIRGLTAGVAGADAARADGYDQLATVRTAKQTQLSRRETLLTMKYGAEDPRVADAKVQQSINQQLTQQIQVIRVQTGTPPPTADPRGYILYGYVRNRQRIPLSKLTVALYDANGRWFSAAGYGCSDENGYYIIHYSGSTKPDTPTDPQKRDPTKPAEPSDPTKRFPIPPLEKGAGVGGQAATVADGDDNSATFEIRVYNSDQKLIYRDPTPLVATIGGVDFREIIIGEGEGLCTPPPGGTDNPPTQKPNTTPPVVEKKVPDAEQKRPAPAEKAKKTTRPKK